MFFDHQVAGHKDQLSFYPGDKSRLIKVCNNVEIEFYLNVHRLDSSLKPFIPRLFESKSDAVVISNLAYDYKTPNVIDIKLGTILHDRGASADKRERMQKVAATTTSGSLGFRICGMKIFKIRTGDFEIFDGNYGKSLCDDNVSQGLISFFKFSTMEELSFIKTSLQELEAAYTESNIVMIGSSLLIIYEGSTSRGKLPTVNLIDFAHSKVLTQKEKDLEYIEYIEERRGVLLGLKNIMKILDNIESN